MRVVIDVPPIFEEIDVRFRVRGKPILFAWGSIIYDPTNAGVPPHLMAHEAVHGQRQGNDIEGWWRRYLDEPAFRLAEEIPAHRAELEVLLGRSPNRQQRRGVAKQVAARLASPLYGGLISPKRALDVLKEAA